MLAHRPSYSIFYKTSLYCLMFGISMMITGCAHVTDSSSTAALPHPSAAVSANSMFVSVSSDTETLAPSDTASLDAPAPLDSSEPASSQQENAEATASFDPTVSPTTGAAAPSPVVATRATQLTVRVATAPDTMSKSGSGATIDFSNCAEGYIMVKYSGSNSKVKLQLTGPNAVTYTYCLQKDCTDAFPLTGGDGNYTANIFENVSGSEYALVLSKTLRVQLTSSLLPYLYPNQYVRFTAQSAAVAKGDLLSSTAATQLDVVANIYNYVIGNIAYDDYKASVVTSGYLPAIDDTLATKKGICFDYASLMAAMLRTQNIPTRLEVGYVSGGLYHAWISVYLNEIGWINGQIQFDGNNWRLMDPTFASSCASSKDIMQFIGNDSNYSAKYVY